MKGNCIRKFSYSTRPSKVSLFGDSFDCSAMTAPNDRDDHQILLRSRPQLATPRQLVGSVSASRQSEAQCVHAKADIVRQHCSRGLFAAPRGVDRFSWCRENSRTLFIQRRSSLSFPSNVQLPRENRFAYAPDEESLSISVDIEIQPVVGLLFGNGKMALAETNGTLNVYPYKGKPLDIMLRTADTG